MLCLEFDSVKITSLLTDNTLIAKRICTVSFLHSLTVRDEGIFRSSSCYVNLEIQCYLLCVV